VENKDINKALAELKKQAADHPKSPRISALYGNWLAGAGKPAEGRIAFEAAKAADPKYLGSDMASLRSTWRWASWIWHGKGPR